MNNKDKQNKKKIILDPDSNSYDTGNGPDSKARFGSKTLESLLAENAELKDQVDKLQKQRQEKERAQRQEFLRRVRLDPNSEEAHAYMRTRTLQQIEERTRAVEEAEEKKIKIAKAHAIAQERALTPKQRADREAEKQREVLRVESITAKINKEKQDQLDVINSFFDSNEKEISEYLSSKHTLSESPVYRIIAESNGFVCTVHRYQKVIPLPGETRIFAANSFTLEPMERHIYDDKPEEHRQAIVKILDQEYATRLSEALEPEDFNKSMADISRIPTRPYGAQIVKRKS
jgi:hypothetical protein